MKSVLVSTAIAAVIAIAGVSSVIAAPAPTTGLTPEKVRHRPDVAVERLGHLARRRR
jgi:hypothetical protein